MRRFTIRTKFFLGMVAVSVTFISISIFIMNRFMGRIADSEVTSNLQGGKRAYERFTALRYDLLTTQARSIAQTPHLKAVMNISDVDHETVFYTAQALSEVIETNLMLLLDVQGKLLADVDDPLLFGHDFRTFPGVEVGLNGAEYHGIWLYRDNLYRIALTPIVLEDQMLGILILGDLLDAAAAVEIREFTGREVLILHSGKVIAQSRKNPQSSSIIQDEIASLVYLLEQIEDPSRSPTPPLRVILGGKACLAVAIPFVNAEGYTVLFRALEEVESGMDVLRISVLAAGAVSIILAVVLSLWLSARVSRPILDLKDAAEQFGTGRLEERVTVHSEDELGQLAKAFNRMAEDILAAQRDLENERAYTEDILRSMIDMLIVLNPDRTIRAVNPATLDCLGYTETELIDQPIGVLFSTAEEDETKEPFAEIGDALTKTGFIRNVENIFLSKDGRKIPISFSGSVIHDDSGKIEGIVCVARDITERKHLENQLRQAQKMETIGLLAGGIAHDFNNLLTVITGYSQLLLQDLDLDALQRNQIEEIQRAGERAVALTHQLLIFSRRQVLQPKVLNLNKVVAGMDKLLRHLIGEDLELVTITDPDLGHVNADPGQLEQVIMNLVINARDAMPQGGKLTIKTANVELDATYACSHVDVQAGPYVLLAVTDTGIGMDAETQSRIFEPFFTTKTPGRGTGLGLSTVYGIVKQSGGFIQVDSEPGKGTTFKIYLPRVEETVVSTTREQTPAETLRGSETILLVEDEEAVRNLACQTLQRNGYTVLEARDGEEALRIGARHEEPIQLLVTDVVMPRMSGRELTEYLASLHSEMKVLYVSGHTDDVIAHHGVLESATAFLQKPFTPEVLTRKVHEVLNTPQQG